MLKFTCRLFLLVIVLGSAALAQAKVSDFDFSGQGLAKTWNEARQSCQSKGQGWDLPTPDQVPLVLQKEMASLLRYYETDSANEKRDFVLWVRAENEDHNIQLSDRAMALRYNSQTDEVSEFDLSQENLKTLEMTKAQLRLIPSHQIRTDEEQGKLEAAIEAFDFRYPMAHVDLDRYEPYSLDHPLIFSLPGDIFTREIIMIMLKYSTRYLETLDKNITLMLHDFSAGLEVTCISPRKQSSILGNIWPF